VKNINLNDYLLEPIGNHSDDPFAAQDVEQLEEKGTMNIEMLLNNLLSVSKCALDELDYFYAYLTVMEKPSLLGELADIITEVEEYFGN